MKFSSLIEDCNEGGEQCSSEEDGWSEDEEKERNEAQANEEVTSIDAKPEQPQLCGWVPPQCCLIPLPASPDGSHDEKEEDEVKSDFAISETELQRQHEKDLEVLFGYKQPLPPPSSMGGTTDGSEGWNAGSSGDVFVGESNDNEVLVAARGNKRCNSSDSGVASISPHSSEGDLEQRSNQNRIETLVAIVDIVQTTNETEQDEEAHTETKQGEASSSSSERCEDEVESIKLNSTPEQCSEESHLPVSRLKPPSETCSVFTGSVSLIQCNVHGKTFI